MFKDLYWLIILLIFALIFNYSNKNNSQYLINEGFKNSQVYIGNSPIKTNKLLNLNTTNFGADSIYEVGRIDYTRDINQPKYQGVYQGVYQDYYSSYI